MTTSERREEAIRSLAASAAKLDAAIPGASEALRLSAAAYNESERYQREFERMMESESCRPPRREDTTIRERLTAHLAAYPVAALYLRAKGQHESAHWSDNTGKGSAGKAAMEILLAGGSIESATIALAKRREVID